MLNNYLTIALRNLRKQPGFTATNVFGLSVGMACCLLVALYIFRETHFDLHHSRANDLYRLGTTFVTLDGAEAGNEQPTFNSPAPMAAALQRDFPDIEKTTRVQRVFQHDKTLIQAIENGVVKNVFNEQFGYFVDSTYFDLFTYEFLEGAPSKALCEPNTVVISEEMAHKFFGNQSALGRVLRISNDWFEGGDLDFRVTGVVRIPDAPTHLKGRFFMSLYSGGLGEFVKTSTNLATNNMFSTYLLLRPGADGQALEAQLPAFVERRMAADLKTRGVGKKQFLTPLPDVHLSSVGNVGRNDLAGSVTYLYILGSIAVFTLLIACVNFMNLSTARSAKRASEVGVRKAVGASQGQLVGQFLTESVLIALCSLVLAFGLAWTALPAFNQLTEQHLVLSVGQNPGLFAGFFGLALATGLLAGLYPAFYLSSFRPVEVLKGKLGNRLSAVFLRKGLVTFQFVLSAGLILASLVVSQQMRFLQSADLGFYKDQQIVLPLSSRASVAAYPALKAELSRDSRVASVGASHFYPGIMNSSDAGFHREGQTMEQSVSTRRNRVDVDFLHTLGVQLVAGRLFSREFPADTAFRLVVNETGVKKYGFASPQEAVGQKIMFTYDEEEYRFEIVGVVKDFHFENLHEEIEPYAFELSNGPQFSYLIAHAKAGSDLPSLLASIESTWKQLVPGEPLEYSFLDEDFQKNYSNDRQMAGLVGALTGIAILIACLGLFGLAAFAAEQRTKEIGIRKVLGASVVSSTNLLAKDFLKLVVVAFLIATPVAWWLLNHWLDNFAYSIEIQWWMFAVAGVVAVGVAGLTVSFQSVKAALANPVKSLRSE